ncbi:MAG: hypothetical protein FWG66_06275 [Spirochaetes bacterium]|nr:hypothetical protein [Spirochaetota bacterium]
MFAYSDLHIISAVPPGDIGAYIESLGGRETAPGSYELGGLRVTLTPENLSLPLGGVWHKLEAAGDRQAAERFLTGFRLKFLTLGG